jgi:hypothetical protein
MTHAAQGVKQMRTKTGFETLKAATAAADVQS